MNRPQREDNHSHPRIKRGRMMRAIKDGTPGESVDQLLANTYMARHVVKKPAYWEKILDLLYRDGRIRHYAEAAEDIVEKFSFLLLAKDQLLAHETTATPDKRFFVKFFTYNYIFMVKSFLDSVAVFLNHIYQLGFSGGKIDLKKGKFLDAVKEQDSNLASEILNRKEWIACVVKYRDNLIHRHGLYIGPLPTVPEDLTDSREIDKFIMREPHYIPTDPDLRTDLIRADDETEFIKVSCLVEDWLAESFQLFDAVLRTFALRFERAEVNGDHE